MLLEKQIKCNIIMEVCFDGPISVTCISRLSFFFHSILKDKSLQSTSAYTYINTRLYNLTHICFINTLSFLFLSFSKELSTLDKSNKERKQVIERRGGIILIIANIFG